MLSCVPNSLQPHRLQHTRLFYPPLFPRVFSNSHPLSWWCCLNISSSVSSFSFCLPSFLASGCFSNESALHIRWPKYWSFSISPSNEYSVLISFRICWFDLLAVQGSRESSPAPQLQNIMMAKKISWDEPRSLNPYSPGLGHLGCLFWQNLSWCSHFLSRDTKMISLTPE